MAERTLIARVAPEPEGGETLRVASPAVGMVDGAPREGTFLNPFDRILTIKILNRRYVLRLPRDVHGRITRVLVPNEYTPVAFDDPLLEIDPRALAGGPAAGAGGLGSSSAGEEGAAEDAIVVTAPSEGIFYRRPAPDAPAFVDVGAEIATGTVLGLVEVMKCFNQITYGGPGLPEKGRVAKILADDVSEVAFGEVLFHIEPLD
jgi:acetyl-CoA carboxylase biotin carboxyl carrier protein